MVNNRLEKWLKEGLKKGYSIDELVKKALEKYSEKDVNDALSKLRKKPAGKRLNLWIFTLILVIAIILVGSFIGASYLQKSRLIEKFCSNINNPMENEVCNTIKTGNITYFMDYCMEYNPQYNEEDCRSRVYYDFGTLTNSSSFCKKIVLENLKKECLEKIK